MSNHRNSGKLVVHEQCSSFYVTEEENQTKFFLLKYLKVLNSHFQGYIDNNQRQTLLAENPDLRYLQQKLLKLSNPVFFLFSPGSLDVGSLLLYSQVGNLLFLLSETTD